MLREQKKTKPLREESCEWKEMYLLLFRAITQALEEMQMQNYGLAAQTLKDAQCGAEQRYLEEQE